MGGPSTYIVGLIALASCQAALAATCGQNITDPAGFIESPGFPIAYDNKLECNWFISPNKTSAFYMRSLTFQTKPIDIVTIRVIRANAGSMAIRPASFSGMNTTLSVAYTIEPGDVIWVRFFVDNYATVQGFRLAYTTPDGYPADSYQCPDGTCLPAPFKCDAVNDCLDGADELASTCADGCSNDSLYHCADGQCAAAGSRCNGIANCNDQSDEGQGCFVSEDIVEGDSLTATVWYQRSHREIRVAVCSDDLCEAINMYGRTSDGLLAYESYAQCNIVDRSCVGGSLVNFNYPLGWTAFSSDVYQFWVSIRGGSLSVSWNNASSVDATTPLPSLGGKRLLIYPLATTIWINRPTEDPSSLSTESSTDAPRSTSTLDPAYTSTTTSPAPVPTTTTPVSTTTSPTTTLTTSTTTPTPPTTPTTTTPVTTAASTSTPTSTVTTTTSAPTRTSPGRSTVITTPQSAASTTSPARRSTTTQGASSPAWISSSTPSANPSDSTPVWTTTGRPATPSSTTSSPGFPTPPTPPPGWPPVPAPPACPLDLPLRYQYLLVPVEGQPQLYVICFAGWGQSMRCPQPLAFSYAQQKCVWSWNASLAAIANKS